jgi:uncharacterized membrane protein
LGDDRLYWKAEIAGVPKEWYARIKLQIPDQVVSWYSESGEETGGEVTFRGLENGKTEVNLIMSYEPGDIVESVGDKLGFISRRVEGDVKRFKEFIESRGVETGAWRGQIRN